MPTLNVNRDLLFKHLQQTFTDDEFGDLCFEFGIELDEVTSEKQMVMNQVGADAQTIKNASDEVIYKIDLPANRPDLLSVEGLVQALNVFRKKIPTPQFKVVAPADPSKNVMVVKAETAQIRPYIVAAVLRGLSFSEEAYTSCIEAQDKLHANICRKRTLVAIGTYDLDQLEGPFTYEALPPTEINFVPLKQTEEFRADKLVEFYENDQFLRHYLHIIRDSPVFPVIYDKNRTVLSMPPIINGASSRITANTKNMIIECTATDLTKAKVVLNTLVTQFSQYCAEPFTVEYVDVVYDDGRVGPQRYPDLSERIVEVPMKDIRSLVGVEMTSEQACNLLTRMMLPTVPSDTDSEVLAVRVPPNRSDVLHPCDVIEDVAIAYGYNNIPRDVPQSTTISSQLPLNKLTDLLRLEVAMAGFTEVLNFGLCSHEENFDKLLRKDDNETAVKVSNPKTLDFQQCRVSLYVGMMKTLGFNCKRPLPLQLFEISDVVLKDGASDTGARNERRLCAAYCNRTSGFEVIHGLLDRLMTVLEVPFDRENGYYIEPSNHSQYFPGRQADVIVRGQCIGHFGIIHPQVLANFGIENPCSGIEINIEPFA